MTMAVMAPLSPRASEKEGNATLEIREDGEAADRPAKRVRFDAGDGVALAEPGSPSDNDADDDDGSEGETSGRLVHPLGVRPIGNFFEDAAKGIRDCRAPGLGQLAALSDVLMLNLLGYLQAADLCALSTCSHACYVFASHDELWRTLVLEQMEGNFVPLKTWKQSYIRTKTGSESLGANCKPLSVVGLYSDLLFQAFYCAAAPIEKSWIAKETIERRSATQLTLEEFKRDFETANRPVILTDCINKWPAMQRWSDEYLIETCGSQTFSAGGFQLSMAQYLHYSRTLVDDQPLFIFDKEFAAKVPQLAEDYDVPEYFQEDFFSLLGEQRPDHRWLIIGPKKSGSSFHIDPNSTNAWNGVIRGAKKWIMFPPEIIPPGVHPSEDGGDVSTPVSLMEWFVTFYPQVRKLPPAQQPLEGICRAGEIIFVPNGWWHLVLNIEESIAITQNFVCQGNAKNVVRFLEDKPDQVSGCPMERRPLLGGLFRQALRDHQPSLLAQIDTELSEERAKKNRKSKWELLLAGASSSSPAEATGAASGPTSSCSSSNGFTFGFTFD
ncbi:hypothetical protein P43SY_004412 [Pythium insidiosum]|uniref:JmjC domain-containing protein n=1 Tax=Pythium insidiosum TaxID=114742 RepID=A0AAD5MA41_PYTIN|nr:hypothetical protein P43SY_004412 [Pythium insidiosum]